MLTDFGAARALEEEETFTSIYGTEEYLVIIDFRSSIFSKLNNIYVKMLFLILLKIELIFFFLFNLKL